MTQKELNRSKKRLDKPKAETITIKGTVTKNQREVIQGLIGIVGSNEQDVVSKILTLWLYNEGFLSDKSPIKIKKEVKK